MVWSPITGKAPRLVAVLFVASVVVFAFLLRKETADPAVDSVANRVADHPAIEGFRTIGTHGEVEIDVSDGVYTVALFAFPTQPGDLKPIIAQALDTRDHDVGRTDSRGLMRVQLSENTWQQANVLVYLHCTNVCDYVGHMEVLRQSAADLLRKFGFRKEDGYSIIGRTSFALPQSPKALTRTASYVRPLDRPMPDLSPYDHEALSRMWPEEIAEAARIMRYIWSRPVRLGPNNDGSVRKLDALTRLERLWEGSWSTQCGDLRDIFLDLAAASPRIPRVRYVGAYQYYPIWPDLIANSHAIAEIYAESIERWVAVDPLFGAFYTLDGQFLSVEEIVRLGAEGFEDVEALNVVEGRSSPIHRKVDESIALEHGYFGYFGTVEYGPEVRSAE